MPIIAIRRPTPEEISARLLLSLEEWAQGYSARLLAESAFLHGWGDYQLDRIGSVGSLPVRTTPETKEERVKRLFAQHCRERPSIAEEVSARDFRAVQAVFDMDPI